MNNNNELLIGIEGGGTSFRVGICNIDDPTTIISRFECETDSNDPKITLLKINEYLKTQFNFDEFDRLIGVSGMGIACFGPIQPRNNLPGWGYITSTPKLSWQFVDIVGSLWGRNNNYIEFNNNEINEYQDNINIRKNYHELFPISFDTDVNGPALAEWRYSNSNNITSCAYITVGTGVGVGLIINGKPVHGLLHPEAGHFRPSRTKLNTSSYEFNDDYYNFKGTCPFHGDCIEGLVSSGALAGRIGCDKSELPNLDDDHYIWDEAAWALASLCANLILLVSPEKIVMSGGIMNRNILFIKIRQFTREILNDYIMNPLTLDRIDELIVPSIWGNDAGLIGALTLAKIASESDI